MTSISGHFHDFFAETGIGPGRSYRFVFADGQHDFPDVFGPAQDAVRDLIAAALKRGGFDNVTVACYYQA